MPERGGISTRRSHAAQLGDDRPNEPARGRADTQRLRQDEIRDRVVAEGYVRNEVLAEQFGVSLMTVHRDLDILQSQGWVHKMRGGATALPSMAFHGSVAQRMATMTEAKRRLAHAALDLVVAGQTLMVDESTTCLQLVDRLSDRTPLTVITHFMAAVRVLAGVPGIHLVGLGGSYFPAYDAFLGLHTAEAVKSFRADVLFMSTTAVTNGRCYHQSQETVHVKRAMIEQAAYRVLLVDHTKFAREGLYALAPLDAFNLVIADSGTSAVDQQSIRDLGVRLRVV